MSTKIAIICSKAFMKRIISIAQNIDNIQLEFYLYNHPSEAPILMKQIKPCDALLFGGTLPFYMLNLSYRKYQYLGII